MGTWLYKHRLQPYWNSLAGDHVSHGCCGTLGSEDGTMRPSALAPVGEFICTWTRGHIWATPFGDPADPREVAS